MAEISNLLVPTFENHTVLNDAKSKAAGRPIYDDLEICKIRFAADRQKVAVFPAHDVEPNATRERGEEVTYAQLYNPQYQKFKNSEAQDVAGTPLSEAPFLTEAKRRELRALNVHTVDALAALDGNPLKQFGMGGRELKNQAQAYLDAATGSADVTAMAAEIARLKQQVAELGSAQKIPTAPAVPESGVFETEDEDTRVQVEGKAIEDCTDQELRDYIKRETGEGVRGNVSRETLVERATECAMQPAEE